MGAQDLLGVAGPGPPAAAAASSSGAPDPLAALGFGAAAQPPQQQGTPPQHAPVTVFDKDGVSVRFAFVKPPGRPDAVDINATYSNAGPSPVTGFTLQVPPAHGALLQRCRTAPYDPAGRIRSPSLVHHPGRARSGCKSHTPELHVNASQPCNDRSSGCRVLFHTAAAR